MPSHNKHTHNKHTYNKHFSHNKHILFALMKCAYYEKAHSLLKFCRYPVPSSTKLLKFPWYTVPSSAQNFEILIGS